MKYRFPTGMRPSNLEEREYFYRKEFNLKNVEMWFEHRKIEIWSSSSHHSDNF